MQKNHQIIEILKTHLFRYQLHSNSSIRMNSFIKNASLSFSKKLRSKLHRMMYFFLLDLKNKLMLLSKIGTNPFKCSTPLNYSSKQVVLYVIPDFFLCIIRRQQIHFFIKSCKAFLDYLRVRLHIYFIFWNLLFSIVVERSENIALPKTKSLKTVLRSPHIDKRSREQFEKIEHRSLMLLPPYLGSLSSFISYVVPIFGLQITQSMLLRR